MTFDCVACKKNHYTSKKIHRAPPPGDQTFIYAGCLRLAAPTADADESLACGRRRRRRSRRRFAGGLTPQTARRSRYTRCPFSSYYPPLYYIVRKYLTKRFRALQLLFRTCDPALSMRTEVALRNQQRRRLLGVEALFFFGFFLVFFWFLWRLEWILD